MLSPGESILLVRFVNRLKVIAAHIVKVVSDRLAHWAEPGKENLVGGAVSDAAKSKRDLIAEKTFFGWCGNTKQPRPGASRVCPLKRLP